VVKRVSGKPERPPARTRDRAHRTLSSVLLGVCCTCLLSRVEAGVLPQGTLDWQTFSVPEFGTTIRYPANVFHPAGKPGTGVGQRFESDDGRAVLSVYSRPNAKGDTPSGYLRRNLRAQHSGLDYTRIARTFFAISSEGDGVVLYSRCNFSRRSRGIIHCFDLKYPQAEKALWDPVVTRMSLSLRPLDG
jgi:hypothetical protein